MKKLTESVRPTGLYVIHVAAPGGASGYFGPWNEDEENDLYGLGFANLYSTRAAAEKALAGVDYPREVCDIMEVFKGDGYWTTDTDPDNEFDPEFSNDPDSPNTDQWLTIDFDDNDITDHIVENKGRQLKPFIQVLSEFKASVAAKGKTYTREDVKALKEAYDKEVRAKRMAESKSNWSKQCERFSEYKKRHGLDPRLTENDKKALRAVLKEESAKNAVVTKLERAKKLTEDAVAGLVQAPQTADPNAMDPNAAPAADAAAPAATNVDPAIQASVQSLLDSVKALATQCGINDGADLTADPNAAIPATTAPTDETGAIMEKVNAAKARINANKAALEEAAKNKATTVGNPTVDQLEKGVSSGAATVAKVWEPKYCKKSKTGSINERKDEKMIDEALNEEKLDFNALIRNGLF